MEKLPEEVHYENNFRLFKKKSGKKPKKKGLFKKIALGIVTGGASNIVRDRKKIAKGIGKGAKTVGKVVKKVTTLSLLTPLIPLVPAMRSSLKKKGLTPPKKLDELARMFYKVIVKKESAFDRADHLVPIAAIIPPIIGFVKNLIHAKKNKAKLPPEEKVVADAAESVINEVEKDQVQQAVASSQAAQQTEGEIAAGIKTPHGSFNFKSPWVLGAIAAVILAIVLIARK